MTRPRTELEIKIEILEYCRVPRVVTRIFKNLRLRSTKCGEYLVFLNEKQLLEKKQVPHVKNWRRQFKHLGLLKPKRTCFFYQTTDVGTECLMMWRQLRSRLLMSESYDLLKATRKDSQP